VIAALFCVSVVLAVLFGMRLRRQENRRRNSAARAVVKAGALF
jgi:hypothetical protein